MDAITAAVSLMSEKAAIARLNTSVEMVKKSAEVDQGVLDLINSAGQPGLQYGSSGAVTAAQAGQVLDAVA